MNDIRRVFHEHRPELEWLAYFITGDRAVAAVCVTQARDLSECHNSVFTEWLLTWARHATVRSAIDTQHDRIKHVSAGYESMTHIQPIDTVAGDILDLAVQESDLLVATLDVVSRTALIICGILKNPIGDAALMLGVSRTAASAAYFKALNSLSEIPFEHLVNHHVAR